MATTVPPGSEGNPPLDGLVVDGKRQALLRLEQMKKDIDAIEAWVETVDAKPAAPPPAGTAAPPPPAPPPAKPKPSGKKHRRH